MLLSIYGTQKQVLAARLKGAEKGEGGCGWRGKHTHTCASIGLYCTLHINCVDNDIIMRLFEKHKHI